MPAIDTPPPNGSLHKKLAILLTAISALCIAGAFLTNFVVLNGVYGLVGNQECQAKMASCQTKLNNAQRVVTRGRAAMFIGIAGLFAGGMYLAYAEGRLHK
jgi:hypothetical protein